MKVTISVRRLRSLLVGIREGTLEPQPTFQRRLVWTNADRVNLLRTVLNGYPFPEVYVASGSVDTNTGVSKELLVDGQQRLSTLFHYFVGSDEIKLPADIPSYAGLSEESRIGFLEYEVVVRDLGVMPHEEIVEIFKRINATQYSLNAMEKAHANYQGEFKTLAVRIANNDFFATRQVFPLSQVRRMADVTFVLTVLATCMSTYFNRQSEVETFLGRYNESFDASDDLEREILEVFRFIDACNLPPKSRAWKASGLLTLLVEVHRAIFKDDNELLDSADIGATLRDFYKAVGSHDSERDSEFPKSVLQVYSDATVQGSNDRVNRIRRGDIIRQILRGTEPSHLVEPSI